MKSWKSWRIHFIPVDFIQPNGMVYFCCMAPGNRCNLMSSPPDAAVDEWKRIEPNYHRISVQTYYPETDFRPVFSFQCPECGTCYDAIIFNG